MKTYYNIIATVSLLVIGLTIGAASASTATLSPGLDYRLYETLEPTSDEWVAVVVFLEHDLPSAVSSVIDDPQLSRSQRLKLVGNSLRQLAVQGASEISGFLSDHADGSVKRHWLVPAYSATIPLDKVSELASMNGVRLVVEDAQLTYDPPVAISKAPATTATADPSGLDILNVRPLWEQGITGQGRLVCSFDTGVDGDHPALAPKWRGNRASLGASWFSKVSQEDGPSDRSGHGTHTMGIMVGSDGADTIGVAPGAEWISAGVIDQGRPLQTTLSDIIDAFQWTLNPDGDTATTDDVPDVISNSWGIPKGLFSPCDATFSTIIEAVEAAGIVVIFAAGNEGPNAMTMRSPADLATTTLSAFSVGAVGYDRMITSFSSRGPSSCDPTEIKPEVVAPGVQIRSSYKDGGYAYLQGTSQAAPFIAGLVALMRQYNPDATVEQIKSALISAAVDLGEAGEDNAYGHGLVDAARLIEYLPNPGMPLFELVRTEVSNDGIAEPGEVVDLRFVLVNSAANAPTVIGHLSIQDGDAVTILNSEAGFFFGNSGIMAMNFEPFEIAVDQDSYHGEEVSFILSLESTSGEVWAQLPYTLTIGIAPEGTFLTHQTARIVFSVSDFGQYGLGPNSIYNAGGAGFSFDGGSNLLYEAGVVVARNPLQLSTSLRDSLGRFRPSDFRAIESSQEFLLADDGSAHSTVDLTDAYSDIPIPVTVSQDVSTFDDAEGVVIMQFNLKNLSIEPLTGLRFGFMADFDLSDGGDLFVYNSESEMLAQRSAAGPWIGLVPLEGMASIHALRNDGGKTGYTGDEMYAMLSGPARAPDNTQAGDIMFLTVSEELTLEPGQSIEMALALVASDDSAGLEHEARRAKELFDMVTDIDDGSSDMLPELFSLEQNYPNPFNPTTAITFALSATADVELDVYNALGQRVITIFEGTLGAGNHQVVWNGTDASGAAVASGVYFYRLSTPSGAQSKKMLLLK